MKRSRDTSSELANEELQKSELFWNIIERKMQCLVPRYLRNLLRLRGFTNVVSVKEMDVDDIKSLEVLAKSETFKKFIPENADLEDYYGCFSTDIESFEITGGYKKMLIAIARFAGEKWNSVGPAFFDPLDSSNKHLMKDFAFNARFNDRRLKVFEKKDTQIGLCTSKSTNRQGDNQDEGENRSLILLDMPHDSEHNSQVAAEFATSDISPSISLQNEHDVRDDVVVEFIRNESNTNMELTRDLTDYQCEQHTILFQRVLKWIQSFHPNVINDHHELINRDMIVLKYEEVGDKISASILCPICKKSYCAMFTSTRNLRNGAPAKPTWNLSNYERHVTNCHSSQIPRGRSSSRISKKRTPQPGLCKGQPGETNTNNQLFNKNLDENQGQSNPSSNPFKCSDESLLNNISDNSVDNSRDNFHQTTITSNSHTHIRAQNPVYVLYQSLRKENAFLEKKCRNLESTLLHQEKILSSPENKLLKLLVDSALSNTNKHKNAYRHEELLKMFTAYVKIVGGKLLHDTLHANLSTSIPSASTVNRFIEDKGPRIVEGVLRVDELKSYLEVRNLPFIVWIAEDATRNIGKVCYDPVSNELVGFVSPLNEHGMPVRHSFLARSATEIENHFLNEGNVIGTMAYAITAQPLSESVPPFILTIFSTDNKFTALNVYNRWKFITHELNRKEIYVYGYSSDGDSKCLKAMKFVTEIGTSNTDNLNCEWLSFGNLYNNSKEGIKGSVYVQDPTHVTTKLRGRICKTSSITPFGNKVITNAHLKILIEKVSKDKHLLVYSDIDPRDKQNYSSAEKICDKRVRQCLEENVAGSEATVIYLKMMNYATASYLNVTLSVSDRIKQIWYAVFLLRIWRSWLLKLINEGKKKEKEQEKIRAKNKSLRSMIKNNELKVESTSESTSLPKKYSLAENYISNNAYTCAELNAYGLIKLIIKLRESNQPELFLPFLLGSQSCESSFRQMRSLTSTFSTVVNFTMYDMLHRVRKIQLQNDIMTKCSEIHFPRMDRKTASNKKPTLLPTDMEIVELIEIARKEAASDARSVGISPEDADFHCQIKLTIEPEGEHEEEHDEENEHEDASENAYVNLTDAEEQAGVVDDAERAELERDIDVLKCITGSLVMRHYENVSLDETSPYTVVVDPTGKESTVRKSSICWLLSQSKHSLSSDRLQRVKENELVKPRKAGFQATTNFKPQSYMNTNQEINIGEWCLMYLNKCYLIGQVLGFSYLNDKSYRLREYSRTFANVHSSDKPIGVLCMYYNWDKNGILKSSLHDSHQFYQDIRMYKATLAEPIYVKKCLQITTTVLELITEFLKTDTIEITEN